MAYEGLGLADVVAGRCYCGEDQCTVQAPWMEQRELDFTGWSNTHGRTLPTLEISKVMRSSTKLEILRLSDNEVGDQGANFLLQGLQHSKSSLRHLELCEVDLSGSSSHLDVAQRIEASLAHNTSLQELDLDDNDLGQEHIEALARAIRSNTTLTRLSCHHNICTDCTPWGELIRANSTLQDLSLMGSLQQRSRPILSALGSNMALTKLDLSESCLSIDDLDVLRESLGSNTTLRTLTMHGTLWVEHGPSPGEMANYSSHTTGAPPQLSRALGDSANGITVLNLSNTSLQSVGFGELCRCYLLRQPNPCLTDLNLRSCMLGADGGQVAAGVIRGNTVLERLSLTNNDIEPEGLHAIALGLEVNRSLVDLQLGFNMFDRDCVEHFLFVLWDTPRRKCLKLGGVPFIQGLSLKDEAERSERWAKIWREKLVAFCMGSHLRLGKSSPLLGLVDQAFECVCEEYFGPREPRAWTENALAKLLDVYDI